MLLMLLNCDGDGATEKNLEPQLPVTSCTEQAGSSTYNVLLLLTVLKGDLITICRQFILKLRMIYLF